MLYKNIVFLFCRDMRMRIVFDILKLECVRNSARKLLAYEFFFLVCIGSVYVTVEVNEADSENKDMKWKTS